MRRPIVSAWFVLLASALMACGGDTEPSNGTDAGRDAEAADAGSDAENDTDAAVECLLQDDGTCPEGCLELRGMPWDEEGQCWREQVTFHCQSEVRGHDAMTCYVNKETGEVYRTSSGYFQPDDSPFRECTWGEERNRYVQVEDVCD